MQSRWENILPLEHKCEGLRALHVDTLDSVRCLPQEGNTLTRVHREEEFPLSDVRALSIHHQHRVHHASD